MPTVNVRAFSHKKSTVIENGGPKLPTAAQLELGEIAINFAKGYETLSIKNNNDEIVTFTNDNYWINKELAIAAALNDLNDRKQDALEMDEIPTEGSENVVTSGGLYSYITEIEQVTAAALNDLNDRITSLALSDDYAAAAQGTPPLAGDTYETAISKLHGAILENELATSGALNDLNTRISDIVIPELILSEDYKPSSLSNDDLFLAPGDSYETAFAKLEKTINDNENITSAALTDLDSRLNLLHLPQSLDDIPDGSTRKLSDYATITSVNSSLATKQNTLVSGTNIKTINNESILGSGNITIQGGSGGDTNVIETVKVNGTALTPDANKAVNITSIPASIVTQDTTHRFVSDTEKTTWNNKISNVQSDWNATSGLAQILNKPTIPDDSNLVHITGYETISGDKTFTGNIYFHGTAAGEVIFDNDNYSDSKIRLKDDENEGWVQIVKGSGTNATTLQAALDERNNVQADWNQTTTTADDYIKNKPTIPAAVTESTVSGWGFTKNTGTVTGVKMNGTTKNPTSGVVDLGTVLTSFTETDPTVPAWAKAVNKPTYTATEVGALPDTTVIPAAPGTLNTTATTAQSTSSSEALSGNITLHKVAKTGTYNDLIGKPTIPTVNNATLTIQKNGTTVNTFTANASSNVTANIQVNELPTVSSSDNGKILQVVNGAWALVTPTSIYSGTSEPDSNTGNNGDLYLQTS